VIAAASAVARWSLIASPRTLRLPHFFLVNAARSARFSTEVTPSARLMSAKLGTAPCHSASAWVRSSRNSVTLLSFGSNSAAAFGSGSGKKNKNVLSARYGHQLCG
jgi:hypothetical protein